MTVQAGLNPTAGPAENPPNMPLRIEGKRSYSVLVRELLHVALLVRIVDSCIHKISSSDSIVATADIWTMLHFPSKLLLKLPISIAGLLFEKDSCQTLLRKQKASFFR